MPPLDQNGAQDVLTTATGQVITSAQYYQSVANAANNGQVYNPTLGFTPVQDIAPGNKYPYRPYYGGLGPRVSVAWNPEVKDGWLGKILGDKVHSNTCRLCPILLAQPGGRFDLDFGAGRRIPAAGWLPESQHRGHVHGNWPGNPSQRLPHWRGWHQPASRRDLTDSARAQ